MADRLSSKSAVAATAAMKMADEVVEARGSALSYGKPQHRD
jgi:hypothetical protein